MFINKDVYDEDKIDLDILKENFELDTSIYETGFTKLSMYKKIVLGGDTINENYNRPAIGPIKEGLYCQYCDSVGDADHSNTCEFPNDDSLYLNMKGFRNYILNDDKYSGDYIDIKNKIVSNNVSKEDISEILIIEEEGEIDDIIKNDLIRTNIPYDGIYKKRGPRKLASKTTTTQMLNNMIIFYEQSGVKTSIRITKNGLINLINIPPKKEDLNVLIEELIKRINNSGSILDDVKYKLVEDNSFIHSITGQFSINLTNTEQINFEELDNIIKPFDFNGNVLETDYTKVRKTQLGDTIINFGEIDIIEWEYSIGRLTRNQVMSKEYIKFVSPVAPGVKLTCIINKGGSFMISLSLCGEKLTRKYLCKEGKTPLSKELINPVYNSFINLFKKERELLIKNTLPRINDNKTFNTVSGYSPPIRLTRTRQSATGPYKEEMRPVPYSWKGNCPDPNYQYLVPEGTKSTKDNLWYPACEAKTKRSIEQYKLYLRHGFPLNKTQEEQLDIIDGIDMGSGIFKEGSNLIGSNIDIYLNGRLTNVTIIKKIGKKNNEYEVLTSDGEKKIINGSNFIRESRVFPGLKDFDRKNLMKCIIKNLNRSLSTIDKNGNIIKNKISEFNEKFKKDVADLFDSLVYVQPTKYFTYNSINDFKINTFNVLPIPSSTYEFYLLLSPIGNYYINFDKNSIESDISLAFEETIILYGYLKFNVTEYKKEYHICDLLFYKTSKQSINYEDRYREILNLQDVYFNQISEEIFVYPDFIENIIEGSFEIINSYPDNKLLFNNISCCDKIIFGEKDYYEDIIQVQVITKNKEVVSFGYEDKEFEYPLNFLSNYPFNKRDIPPDFFVGSYYDIKINRDFNGEIVPNRKISIISGQKTKKYTYNEIVDILYIKFINIEKDFFSSEEEWNFISEKLYYNDNLRLVSSAL